MGEATCTKGVRRICEPHKSNCEYKEECIYSPLQVREELKPESLDGNTSTYTEVEKASLAYALQPFEIRPAVYEIFEGNLSKIYERMQTAFQAFQKKTPTLQLVWLTIDTPTQNRLLSQGKDPNLFLRKVKPEMEKYLKDFGVSVAISKKEPSKPHATIIYTDNEAALVATRERRIQAVRNLFFTDHPENIKKLQEILEWVQNVANPESSIEDIYDIAAMQSDFGKLIYIAEGWAPIDREDVANLNPNGFAFVKIHPSQMFQPQSLAYYPVTSVHELGHLVGLEHPNVITFLQGEDVLIMNAHAVSFQEEARVQDKIREFQEKLKDLKLNGREKASLKRVLGELKKDQLPTHFVWGEQATTYLKAALK